jgi:hypothetical protein
MGAVNPSDPQTLNRYAYVRGNPLALTDPDGQMELDWVWMGTPNPIGDIIGIATDLASILFGLFGGGGHGALPTGPPTPANAGPNFSITKFGQGYADYYTADLDTALDTGGPAGLGGWGPVDTNDLISKAPTDLSQNCNTKFGRVIPGYTKAAFFKSLLSATIEQYPAGTPNIPTHMFGADAETMIRMPGAPIRLFPNFYGAGTAGQIFTLIHEGIHHFTKWTDPTVFTKFRSSGLRQVNPGTHDITNWIQGGCKP